MDPGHRVSLLVRRVIVATVLTAAPAAACDELLRVLVEGRGGKTAFDRQIEVVSSRLTGVMAGARGEDWTGAAGEYTEATRAWLAVYRDHLAQPPAHLADHPDWRGSLKHLSGLIAAVREDLDEKDSDDLHQRVLEAQIGLVETYMAGLAEGAKEGVRSLIGPLERGLERLEAGRLDWAYLVLCLRTSSLRLQTLARMEAARELGGRSADLLDRLRSAEALAASARKIPDPGPGDREPLENRFREIVARAREFGERFLERSTPPTPTVR